MDQLWNVALKATNTDVSITAIQILNSYYINYGNGQLEKEEEFVQRCMDSLVKALTDLDQVHNEIFIFTIVRSTCRVMDSLKSLSWLS